MIINIKEINSLEQAKTILKNCPICECSLVVDYDQLNCIFYKDYGQANISDKDCPFSYLRNEDYNYVRLVKTFGNYSCGMVVGFDYISGTQIDHCWIGDSKRYSIDGLDDISINGINLENVDIVNLYSEYQKFILNIPKLLLMA